MAASVEERSSKINRLDWWSWQPIQRTAVPLSPSIGRERGNLESGNRALDRTVRTESTNSRNAIDAFILSRLDQEGMAASSTASPTVLIHRLYSDLIGMPPSPEESMIFWLRMLSADKTPMNGWSIVCLRALAMVNDGLGIGSTRSIMETRMATTKTNQDRTLGLTVTM